MSKKVEGGPGSPGRRFVMGGRAGRAPLRGMRWTMSSRKINDAGYGDAPRRPGRGPGQERGRR